MIGLSVIFQKVMIGIASKWVKRFQGKPEEANADDLEGSVSDEENPEQESSLWFNTCYSFSFCMYQTNLRKKSPLCLEKLLFPLDPFKMLSILKGQDPGSSPGSKKWN